MRFFQREAEIIDLVRGQKVLHLGCVGFSDLPSAERTRLADHSFHRTLSQIADVTGIDNAEDAIIELRRKHIFDNILVGDLEHLEALDLDATFDAVVAGDVIEHVSNPGLMLDGLRRFCRPDTRVLFTTPNTFGVLNFARFVFGRFRDGADHVMGFNEQNLTTLLRRHGFVVDEVHTCYQRRVESAHPRALVSMVRFFLRMLPRLGGTLFVVAKAGVSAPNEVTARAFGIDAVVAEV